MIVDHRVVKSLVERIREKLLNIDLDGKAHVVEAANALAGGHRIDFCRDENAVVERLESHVEVHRGSLANGDQFGAEVVGKGDIELALAHLARSMHEIEDLDEEGIGNWGGHDGQFYAANVPTAGGSTITATVARWLNRGNLGIAAAQRTRTGSRDVGTLLYGSPGIEVDFDDRALMHLQVVITAKLRRHESFLFSWSNSSPSVNGRSSVWLHPAIPLFYRFSGSRVPSLNREWIDLLLKSANSSAGLVFVHEPTGSQ